MGQIHILHQQVANSIAAGEVVERPASVVKELCENALDALATTVRIDVQNGGISRITIHDDGVGMDREDAVAAFDRHATSKLSVIEDLDSIGTMGFRGEALASIAAVSRVTLQTRQAGAEEGTRVRLEGGTVLEHGTVGCAEGTTITVEELFFNTPARYKFLRKDRTEAGYIGDLVERLALARPDVSFLLTVNGKEWLRTPGNNDLRSTVFAVFGRDTADHCLPLEFRQESLLLSGFAGRPETARSNRSRQIFHVNGRVVQSRVLTAAVEEAYRARLVRGKHPFVLLRIEIPPNLVDVNVHPQKLEVRFWNDGDVYVAVLRALREALDATDPVPDERDLSPAAEFSELPTASEPAPESDTTGEKPAGTADFVYQQPELNAAGPESAVRDPFAAATPEPAQPEPIPDAPVDPTFWSEARTVGVAFRTYVILEWKDSLLVLDQHAAHERILFEKLLYREAAPAGGVPLLVPERLDLSLRETQILQDRQEDLAGLGFELDLFGERTVVLRSIPADPREMHAAPAFRAALDTLMDEHPATDGETAHRDRLADMACKAAVKAGDTLKEPEIRSLLQRLSGLQDPYHCPHGRPVLFRMTRTDLEKRFRRIV